MTSPKEFLCPRDLLTTALIAVVLISPTPAFAQMRDAITVVDRKTLAANKIDCERIALGEDDDYKPDLIMLPNGELLLVMFQNRSVGGGKVREDMFFYRSADGGRTWGKRQLMPLLGREPYFSVLRDGTLFITTHLLADDVRNTEGYIHSYVHRSTDGGKNWITLRIGAEDLPGVAKKTWTHTSRNVLELKDGTLILGVSAGSSTDYLWRSKDKGKTWDKSLACKVSGFDVKAQGFPWHAETVFWQASNGDILAIARCFSGALPKLAGTDIPKGDDSVERMAVFRSKDIGRNWTLEPELGSYYGEHYQTVLRLNDKRLLFTFTVRGLRPPLGLQAVFGVEKADGFTFDFKTDRLVLDQKTPANKPSGGGFGNTVQLKDGSLVSTYSYRDKSDKTHVEVIRWQLPEAPKKAERQSFLVEPGVRQLFLDDVGVEKIEGLKRIVNQPKRHPGNPVLKGDFPWEKASVYGTMFYDEKAKIFRLWYLCSPEPPKGGRKWVEVGGYRRVTNCTLLAYATSKDGVKWDKPELNQLSFEGSKKNNLIDIGIDNPEGVGVLHAPLEKDPARRFVAFFWDRRLTPPDDPTGVDDKLAQVPKEPPGLTEKQRSGGMWVAFSPDGVTWKTHGPVLPQGSDTTHTILYDAKLKKYVGFGRMGFGRTVARTESDDGLEWIQPKLVLACDATDGPGGQIYGMPTDLYEGLYVGMFWMYREGTDARIDTQLAVSRDGIRWSRVADRQTFLPNAKEGSWDDGMSRAGRGINVVGDTIYLHYSMVNGPHRSARLPKVERKYPGAIGLVTLRRDGFVSLDAGEQAGTLLTKPFVPPAGPLHVNVAAADGTLRVAVCDETGRPIKGFEESQKITVDTTGAAVSWGDAKLERLRGQSIRLRFTLQNTKLFSYWFGEAK